MAERAQSVPVKFKFFLISEERGTRAAMHWCVALFVLSTLAGARPLEVPHLGQRSNVASIFAVSLTSSVELPKYAPLM